MIDRLAPETNANHHDRNVAGLRFLSVYQGFGGNEEHKGKYANTVAQFADGEAPELFGDGTQTRDFTHVSDIAPGLRARRRQRADGRVQRWHRRGLLVQRDGNYN